MLCLFLQKNTFLKWKSGIYNETAIKWYNLTSLTYENTESCLFVHLL